MAKIEKSGYRNLHFSRWLRNDLPSSVGFVVSDLDFIICNQTTKKLMLLEVKTFGNEIEQWQRNLFNLLDSWLKNGVFDDWTYLGFHLLEFEGKPFEIIKYPNGDIEETGGYFDGDCKTERELMLILNLQ